MYVRICVRASDVALEAASEIASDCSLETVRFRGCSDVASDLVSDVVSDVACGPRATRS